MTLTLFVWRGPDVLRNYSSGIAFALAPDVDTARRMITADYQKYVDWEDWTQPDPGPSEWDSSPWDKLRFLERDPEVFTSPVAIFVNGGD